MKYFILIMALLLGLVNSVEARSTYCIRNNATGSFYLYDKSGNQLAEIKAGDRKSGISEDSFPLTASSCSSGPKSCNLKDDNYTIDKKGCYIVAYFSGYYTTDLACLLC